MRDNLNVHFVLALTCVVNCVVLSGARTTLQLSCHFDARRFGNRF
ncbi:hypothetical protein C7S13_3175 [Burkholderia cepacia]|nr:hypothetical protein [Burkholderia cepacia]MDW9244509.1 hypothetical protein [Burkholderia cepacia]